MVAAPTYGMLSDATLRGFLQVALKLGVIGPRDVKKSAPINIRLRTGAEVLFRSADDPARLYGPNLSGIFLDEASIMPVEVFTVGIGRLREAGEQGFLTACFTPKGRAHWTYDVFATGKPGTSIHFSRTRDNPFLPPEFEGNVRSQYTSQLARQELEGEFVDFEGGLFRRDWFAIREDKDISTASIVKTVRAWDLAATAAKPGKDPDWSVGVLLGKTADGEFYILDVKRLRGTPGQVEDAVKKTAEEDGKTIPVHMEQEPGSSGVALAYHYARRILTGFNFRPERSTGDKATRAQPLAAAAERGLVKLAKGHWNKDFLDELEVFPQGAHDDQVDACSLAFNKLATKQELWVRCSGMQEAKKPPGMLNAAGVEIVDTPMGRQHIFRESSEPSGIDISPDAPFWHKYR